MADFFKTFYSSWTSDRTRPQPIILDTQYDWDDYYRAHLQKLSYFSKSHNNELYVPGFRFEWSTEGIIEMKCKGSPSALKWCGRDGIPDGPGFRMLKSFPVGAPNVVLPSDSSLCHDDVVALSGKGVRRYCELLPFGPQSHDWLIKMAKTGQIPSNGPVPQWEQSQHKHVQGWGTSESMGPRTNY